MKASNYKSRSMAAAAILVMLLFSSCLKTPASSSGPAQATDIYSILSGSSGYSILTTAIQEAGFKDSLFAGKGPYTVFASSDQDFKIYFNLASPSDLSKLSSDSIKTLVSYFVFKGAVSTSSIPNGKDSAKQSFGGLPVYFTKGVNTSGGSYIYVNGAPLLQGDYPASNGLVQVIAGVLNPPRGSSVAFISKSNQLTLFNAAVAHCNLGGTLSGAGLNTVFAPNDSAFSVAGYKTIQDINNADPALLGKIISYHIVPGRLFSSDFKDGSILKTLNGGSITIGLSYLMTVKGASNATASTVTLPNRSTANGVVYFIDQVLNPGS